MKIIIELLITALGFWSCSNTEACVEGSGVLVMSDIEVDDITEVVNSTDLDVRFILDDWDSIDSILIDEDLRSLFTFEVLEEALTISRPVSDCIKNYEGASVTLMENSFAPVASIVNTGSGMIEVCPYGQNMSLTNSGSGNFYVNFGCVIPHIGPLKYQKLSVDNSGSGSITTEFNGFFATYSTILNSGSGDVHVNADTLDVTISGSGNVFYKGNPKIIGETITGTGELIDNN